MTTKKDLIKQNKDLQQKIIFLESNVYLLQKELDDTPTSRKEVQNMINEAISKLSLSEKAASYNYDNGSFIILKYGEDVISST